MERELSAPSRQLPVRRPRALPWLLGAWLFAGAAAAYAQVSVDTKPCGCAHGKADIAALKQDLKNAENLRDAFKQESADLRKKYGAHPDAAELKKSLEDEKAFAASQTVTAPPGYVGPLSCTYTSLSVTVGLTIPKGHECDPDSDALECLQRAVDGSVCAGMARAIVAHEQVHWNTCRRIGDPVYWNRSGADLAAEEAQAYDAQAKILAEELKNAERRANRKPGFWSSGILGHGGFPSCPET